MGASATVRYQIFLVFCYHGLLLTQFKVHTHTHTVCTIGVGMGHLANSCTRNCTVCGYTHTVGTIGVGMGHLANSCTRYCTVCGHTHTHAPTPYGQLRCLLEQTPSGVWHPCNRCVGSIYNCCTDRCAVCLDKSRVGQNHVYIYIYIYTVYIRYFWQGNHCIYGHIRCIYTVLANRRHKPSDL